MSLISWMLMGIVGQEKPRIEKGQPAPPFQAPNQKGKEIRLSDHRDKKNVLLAFYPMDFTPG